MYEYADAGASATRSSQRLCSPASYSGASWSDGVGFWAVAIGSSGRGKTFRSPPYTTRAFGSLVSTAWTIAAPYAACSRRCPTRLSGPDEKWLATAQSVNRSVDPGPAFTVNRATCAARV